MNENGPTDFEDVAKAVHCIIDYLRLHLQYKKAKCVLVIRKPVHGETSSLTNKKGSGIDGIDGIDGSAVRMDSALS